MALVKRALMTNAESQKVKEVLSDPVKWAQIFVNCFDNATKQRQPWVARWYQGEMMNDPSDKKVYRCGRRTGKTETMVIETMRDVTLNKHFRVLILTPYESQVRLIFTRINEILDESPALKAMVTRNVKNPYILEFKNGSAILGFTTGASSGSGAASVRGQKADKIVLDEVDYMTDADFDSIMAIAGEREGIKVVMSSTPTGRRGRFYEACTNPKLGFNEHYHPSMHNPGWTDKLEAEFRAMLSEEGYTHEILAEFGTEECGVFNKDKVDAARSARYYAYNELTYLQKQHAKFHKEKTGQDPEMLLYSLDNLAPYNLFRCVGVDWDKYGASSSIIVLDYDVVLKKFIVLSRIELPKSEYSYDTAVNKIIEINNIYNPSWIYCDAGSGEYQLERLHIYGEEHPETGLKHKVIRRNFKQALDITDPITHEIDKKPLKQFMVTQLQIAFERDSIVFSPYDEVLHKQLIDYQVVKFTGITHDPVFTNKNEHYVDALGLAYLAFVLEFNELIDMVKDVAVKSATTQTKSFAKKSIGSILKKDNSIYTNTGENYSDPFKDEPFSKQLINVPLNQLLTTNYNSHSKRSKRSNSRRSMW